MEANALADGIFHLICSLVMVWVGVQQRLDESAKKEIREKGMEREELINTTPPPIDTRHHTRRHTPKLKMQH